MKLEQIRKSVTLTGIGSEKSPYFLYLLLAIVLFGYVIPMGIYQNPTGSDVYTHMYNTMRMVDSRSLNDFYEKTYSSEYQLSDYPFGMWYFGAIVMKLTGLSSMEFLVSFSIIFLGIALTVFYIYARSLLMTQEKSILALIFFVSTPLLVLNIMNYSTNIFVSVILMTILLLTLRKASIRNFAVVLLLVFTLVFTHTGTFMFLLFFATAYFFISAFIWRKIDRNMYFIVLISLVLYISAIRIFPFVQAQYIDKGRMILSVGSWAGSALNLPVLNDLALTLYDNVFVSNNIIYAVFWACLIYAIGLILVQIRSRIDTVAQHRFYTVPIIGSITNLSHGVTMTPIWMGPIQSFLSIFGFLRLDARGKNILLSLIAAAVLPGALQGSGGTGSLREVSYLFLAVPLCAAEGFFLISDRLSSPRFLSGTSWSRLRRILPFIFYSLIFLPMIVVPIIGNLHYQPQVFGTMNEKEGLTWLGTVGNPGEGVSSFVYRERIVLYANKSIPSISPGPETSQYLQDLEKVYFSPGAMNYTDDLYSFNIKYLITSQRILKEYPDRTNFSTGSNIKLDRIYASDDGMGLYRYIGSPPAQSSTTSGRGEVVFIEGNPAIEDSGPTFIFSNDAYKVKLSHATPRIRYIGTNTKDFLQEGEIYDYVTLSWPGEAGRYIEVDLNDLTYPEVILEGNRVSYRTTVLDEHGTCWATLRVTYEFYEHAVRREITLANDWTSSERNDIMNVGLSTSILSPSQEFTIGGLTGSGPARATKHIYPSQDFITIRNRKFSDVYLKEGGSGLLVRYGDTSSHPDTISYKGEILYDYSTVTVESGSQLGPSDSVTITQFFSVGSPAEAEKNADRYTSVSPSPYPNGALPLAIAGFLQDVGGVMNTSTGGNPFSNASVIYHKILSTQDNVSQIAPKDIIGYVNSYENEYFKGPAAINTEVRTTKNLLGAKGILFSQFNYNPDAMEALSENGISYLLSYFVPPPGDGSADESVRDLRMAYIAGNRTGVVLVPVTSPDSQSLRYSTDPDTIFAQWNETLVSLDESNGIAAYIWNAGDITNPLYSDRFLDLLNTSRKLGITTVDLEVVAEHFRQMQNVSARCRLGLDSATLEISNGNKARVSGITYRVNLPGISGRCPYRVENGTISRRELAGETCRLSVSTDAGPGGEKTLIIEPEIERVRFAGAIPALYEGTNSFQVRDEPGNPVRNATIWVDGRSFESDGGGMVTFPVTRGTHTFLLEKPGFYSLQYEYDVPGNLIRYLPWLRQTQAGAAPTVVPAGSPRPMVAGTPEVTPTPSPSLMVTRTPEVTPTPSPSPMVTAPPEVTPVVSPSPTSNRTSFPSGWLPSI